MKVKKFIFISIFLMLLVASFIFKKELPHFYINENLLGHIFLESCKRVNDNFICDFKKNIKINKLNICYYDYYGSVLKCEFIFLEGDILTLPYSNKVRKITIGT